MRTSGGKAAPSSRWPEVLFRVLMCCIPLAVTPFGAAFAAGDASAFDPRTLLILGISLGIIAFAVGTAIVSLRAADRARRAEAVAEIEAERYRLSESTLETLLTAEPQALLIVAESGEAELLVASLPAALGVPRDTAGLLNFAGWLDASSAKELDNAIDALAERGASLHADPPHAARSIC